MKAIPRLIALAVISTTTLWACNKSGKQPPNHSMPGAESVQASSSREEQRVRQLSILQKYIDEGQSIEYFKNEDYKILFNELEQQEIDDLENRKLFFYKVEDNSDPNGHIYVFSSSDKRTGISTSNTLAAWTY